MNSLNVICNKTRVDQSCLIMVEHQHKKCSQLISHTNKYTMLYGNKICNSYHSGSLATESVMLKYDSMQALLSTG
jgi:hypothetical protein